MKIRLSSEAYSELSQISKMEHYERILNNFKPLTIFENSSFDVRVGSECPSDHHHLLFSWTLYWLSKQIKSFTTSASVPEQQKHVTVRSYLYKGVTEIFGPLLSILQKKRANQFMSNFLLSEIFSRIGRQVC